MKAALSIATGVITGLLAIYVGLYLMLVGGITQVVNALQETPIEGIEIGWGVARVAFASLVTFAIIFVGGFITVSIWESHEIDQRRARRAKFATRDLPRRR